MCCNLSVTHKRGCFVLKSETCQYIDRGNCVVLCFENKILYLYIQYKYSKMTVISGHYNFSHPFQSVWLSENIQFSLRPWLITAPSGKSLCFFQRLGCEFALLLHRWSVLQEGGERGADGPSFQSLLDAEVVDHTLLHLLLCRCEEQAAKHCQLREREKCVREYENKKWKILTGLDDLDEM